MSQHESGFTLLEMIIVVFIAGILSAIATPSFLAMYNRAKVNNAVTTVQGALQEAQRGAMRSSKRCSVTIPEGNSPLTVTSTGCLITGDRKLESIAIDNRDSAGDVIGK